MTFDLGLQGLALLVIPALMFGLVAQVICWRGATHRMWLIGSAAWVVGGLVASEVILGAETTEENLQPLIDGLLWDEALLGGFVTGLVAVAVTWFATRERGAGHVPAH